MKRQNAGYRNRPGILNRIRIQKIGIALAVSISVCTGFSVPAQAEASGEDEVLHVLLIGQDRREGEERQRSDTMILATLDEGHQLSLTSFMRDLYVEIPGHGEDRINAAYAFGGMELLDATIENNFGIAVDGNIEVDFQVFQTLIDEIDGIDLELTQAEADYICGRDQSVLYPQPLRTDWDLQEGMNHLTGEQALIHVRNRSIGNSDYRRTERQREVAMAAFEKLKTVSVTTLFGLAKDVLPKVTTDLSLGQILSYVKQLSELGDIGVASYQIPADGTYSAQTIRGMQVLVPDKEANKKYLQEIFQGKTPAEE